MLDIELNHFKDIALAGAYFGMGMIVNLGKKLSLFLNAGFPNWMFSPGLRLKNPQHIQIDDLDAFLNDPQSHLKSIKKPRGAKKQINVILGGETVLFRTVYIPKKARKNAAKIIKTKTIRDIPIEPSDLLWTIDPPKDSRADSLEFAQAIVKRDNVDVLENTLSLFGFKVRSIAPLGFKAFFLDNTKSLDTGKNRWSYLNLSLIVGILGYLCWGLLNANTAFETHAEQSRETNKAVRAQVLSVTKAQRAQAELAAQRKALYEDLNAQRGRTIILSNLTNAFPDTAWVSEFVLEGSSLSLSGFTTQSTAELVELLNELPIIESSKLLSSVLADKTTNSKRFQIQVTLKVEKTGQ